MPDRADLSREDLSRIDAELSRSLQQGYTERSPYAICTAALGSQHTAKWERCVKHVADSLKKAGKLRDLTELRDSIPGGRYVALQDEDGTWRITSEDGRGVPVMSTMPENTQGRGNPEIDRAWMERCLARHQFRESEDSYLPPVHLNHHTRGDTRQLGFLRLTAVGKIRYEGEPRDALFAEIVGVEEADLDQLEKLKLPYVSPEVKSWDDPEFKSLAMMSDEAPYFKGPLVRVGRKIPKAERFSEDAAPAVAACTMRDRASALFDFSDIETVPQETIPVKNKPGAAAAKELAEDKDPPEKKKDGEMQDEDGLLQKILAAIEEQLRKALEGLPKTIAAAVGGALPFSAAKPEGSPGPVEFAEKPEGSQGGAKPAAAAAAKVLEFAELAGKVAALEGAEVERKRAGDRRDYVAAKVADLKKRGFNLHDATMAAAVEQAGLGGENYKRVVDGFFAEYERSAPKDPRSLAEIEQRAKLPADPPEVLKYAKEGPEALEEARKLEREFRMLRDQGLDLREPLATFIEVNRGKLVGAGA